MACSRYIAAILALLVATISDATIAPVAAHVGHHSIIASLQRVSASSSVGGVVVLRAHIDMRRRSHRRIAPPIYSGISCSGGLRLIATGKISSSSLFDGCCQGCNCSHCGGACSHLKGCASSCAHGGVIASAFVLRAPRPSQAFVVCQQTADGREPPPELKPPQA